MAAAWLTAVLDTLHNEQLNDHSALPRLHAHAQRRGGGGDNISMMDMRAISLCILKSRCINDVWKS